MDKFCRTCGRPLDKETGFCPDCEPDLVRAARKYLPADDDETIFIPPEEQEAVQEQPSRKWRQDILEDQSVPAGETGGSDGRNDRPAGDEPPTGKKKKKVLPVVLTVLICFIAGAMAVHFIGGAGRDGDEDQRTAETTTSVEASTEEPTSTPDAQGKALYLNMNGSSMETTMYKNREVSANQLIVVSREGYEGGARQIADKMDAEIAGQNDYDRSALLQWKDPMTESELAETIEKLRKAHSDDLEEVWPNYVVRSDSVQTLNEEGELSAGTPWNIEAVNAKPLKEAAKDSRDSAPKIGFICPDQDGVKIAWQIVQQIIPDENTQYVISRFVRTGDAAEQAVTVYDLTCQLAELIAEKGEDSCQVLCCSAEIPSDGQDYLRESLKSLDGKMAGEKCLICYGSGFLDKWEKTDSISGLCIGSARKADREKPQYQAVSSNGAGYDVMAPGAGIPLNETTYSGYTYSYSYSGDILAVAHGAGFAADVFSIDASRTAEGCGDLIRETAKERVSGAKKAKLIDGEALANDLNNSEADGGNTP